MENYDDPKFSCKFLIQQMVINRHHNETNHVCIMKSSRVYLSSISLNSFYKNKTHTFR